jgi:hypothetical protein
LGDFLAIFSENYQVTLAADHVYKSLFHSMNPALRGSSSSNNNNN